MHNLLRTHHQRLPMDRRCFEAAHLKYACLKMAVQYPDAIPSANVQVESCIFDTLNEITPALFQSFEARYAGVFVITPYC